MTPEQFKIFMEVFQNHLRNSMHHLDMIFFVGIPGMILFIILLILLYKIHIDLKTMTELMRVR